MPSWHPHTCSSAARSRLTPGELAIGTTRPSASHFMSRKTHAALEKLLLDSRLPIRQVLHKLMHAFPGVLTTLLYCSLVYYSTLSSSLPPPPYLLLSVPQLAKSVFIRAKRTSDSPWTTAQEFDVDNDISIGPISSSPRSPKSPLYVRAVSLGNLSFFSCKHFFVFV